MGSGFLPLKYQSGAIWVHKGEGPDVVIVERWGWSNRFVVRPTAESQTFTITQEKLELEYEAVE